MDLAKPCTTPMATTIRLSQSDTPSTLNTSMYRNIVGSLHYLSLTHLDIAYVIHRVSKFMHDPYDSYWQVVKRILRYLKHTISGGLFLSKNSTLKLHGFTDIDWIGNGDDKLGGLKFCFSLF